jgi:8-hydroxy-5-deazaflavin:NADPH oxidoreductase
MKIAIIGAGSVGGTLGRRWAELGHSVCFGVRNVGDADAKALVGAINGDARLASSRDAAKDAEVVVLATPYAANAAAVTAAGDLSGKILIDVTNPIGSNFSLAVGFNSSGAEEVAKVAPRAKVYKAMNQVGFEVMADSSFAAGRPVMFVAGDDAAGKKVVLELVSSLGLRGYRCRRTRDRTAARALRHALDPPDGASQSRPQFRIQRAAALSFSALRIGLKSSRRG